MQVRRNIEPAAIEAERVPPPRAKVSPGVYCDLRCGRCHGTSYTDEDGDLACVNCGRAVLVNAETNVAR